MNMEPRKTILFALAILFLLIVMAFSVQKAMDAGLI